MIRHDKNIYDKCKEALEQTTYLRQMILNFIKTNNYFENTVMSDLKEFPIDQMHKEVESIYHILNESLKPIQDPKTPKKYEFPDLQVISLK